MSKRSLGAWPAQVCYWHQGLPAVAEMLVIVEGRVFSHVIEDGQASAAFGYAAPTIYSVPVCAKCCARNRGEIQGLALFVVTQMRARRHFYYRTWCRN